MLLVTRNAIAVCSHELGVAVLNACSQDWVTVGGSSLIGKRNPLLVEPDPENRTISGCPNTNVGIDPCEKTLTASKGYSSFVRIGGKPVCLDSLSGPTNGTPGDFVYHVRDAGQDFVECSG